MSTNPPNENNEIKSVEEFKADLERLFSDPDFFENKDSSDQESGSGASGGKKRRSLASHHRSHHHHSHSGKHHHSSKNTESSATPTNTVTDTAAEVSIHSTTETKTDKTIEPAGESVSTSDAASPAAPRKRIPLAAHHRSHRHSSSEEHHHSHHHSSRHSSHHRHSSSTRQYYGDADLKGKSQTLEIDRETIVRLSEEHTNINHNEKTDITRKTEQNMTPEDVQTNVSSTDNTDIEVTDEETNSSMEAEVQSEDSNQPSQPRLGSAIVAAQAANPRKTRKASTVESTGARQRRKAGKRPTAFQIIAGVLIAMVVLLLGGISAILIMRAQGQASMTPKADEVEIVMPVEDIPEEVEEVEDDGKTVFYKGQKYRWNENITTILFMGTDRTVDQQESGMTVAGKNGQADTLLLGVIDNANKKISFININRDTFVPVAEYTADGDYAGEKEMQICLAYSYGRTNEESCEYTAEAVSKYLYGMPVNAYAGISYDAIKVLNDSVGGVTVTILEDMTDKDASFEKGATVTLVGDQAMLYVRVRDPYITETNENRMARQKQYLIAFMKRAVEATREDITLPLGLYANAAPYMTTNISTAQVTYLTSRMLEYGISEDAIHSIPGQSVDGADNHVEYHPDKTALYELILETFYNKVE